MLNCLKQSIVCRKKNFLDIVVITVLGLELCDMEIRIQRVRVGGRLVDLIRREAKAG